MHAARFAHAVPENDVPLDVAERERALPRWIGPHPHGQRLPVQVLDAVRSLVVDAAVHGAGAATCCEPVPLGDSVYPFCHVCDGTRAEMDEYDATGGQGVAEQAGLYRHEHERQDHPACEARHTRRGGAALVRSRDPRPHLRGGVAGGQLPTASLCGYRLQQRTGHGEGDGAPGGRGGRRRRQQVVASRLRSRGARSRVRHLPRARFDRVLQVGMPADA